MKKNDYYTMAAVAAKAAAAGLTDAQVLDGLLEDRAYLTALANGTANTAAEQAGVKKTVATYFDAFRNTFVRAVEERRRELKEKAKPVFWGARPEDDLSSVDVTGWTLLHQMQEVRSTASDLANECRRIIRDAQQTLTRVEHMEASKVVNDKLYPIYDENLGRMAIAADVAIAKLREKQEATRTMITLAGMRLPVRAELVAAGLLAPTPEELAEALLPQQAPAADGSQQ